MSQTTPFRAENATFYASGEMMGNYHRVECRSITITREPFAQYREALKLVCLPKGKRKPRGRWFTYKPRLVVLEGFGHFEPAPLFGAPERTGTGLLAQTGRHAGFSSAWDSEFDEMLSKYLEQTGARVLFDVREK